MYQDFYLQVIVPAIVKTAIAGCTYLILCGEDMKGNKINLLPSHIELNQLIDVIKEHGYKVLVYKPTNTTYISWNTEYTIF